MFSFYPFKRPVGKTSKIFVIKANKNFTSQMKVNKNIIEETIEGIVPVTTENQNDIIVEEGTKTNENIKEEDYQVLSEVNYQNTVEEIEPVSKVLEEEEQESEPSSKVFEVLEEEEKEEEQEPEPSPEVVEEEKEQ